MFCLSLRNWDTKISEMLIKFIKEDTNIYFLLFLKYKKEVVSEIFCKRYFFHLFFTMHNFHINMFKKGYHIHSNVNF